jgi:hypothetical protein
MLQGLARIAALLDRNGFMTLSFTEDIRCDGAAPYYIDFGFDLGEPSRHPSSRAFEELSRFCIANDAQFPRATYESIFNH